MYISHTHISFSLKIGSDLKCCMDRCWNCLFEMYYWIHPPIMPSARVPDLMICRNIYTKGLLLELKGTSYRM